MAGGRQGRGVSEAPGRQLRQQQPWKSSACIHSESHDRAAAWHGKVHVAKGASTWCVGLVGSNRAAGGTLQLQRGAAGVGCGVRQGAAGAGCGVRQGAAGCGVRGAAGCGGGATAVESRRLQGRCGQCQRVGKSFGHARKRRARMQLRRSRLPRLFGQANARYPRRPTVTSPFTASRLSPSTCGGKPQGCLASGTSSQYPALTPTRRCAPH